MTQNKIHVSSPIASFDHHQQQKQKTTTTTIIMAPTLLTAMSLALPKVVRKPADAPSPDDATTLLPLGIQLTGGAKLCQDGKTGKGIKVAVIDLGIDAEHPGFNGQVKHQMWFHGGSPLAEDDHGTHVAGTIH